MKSRFTLLLTLVIACMMALGQRTTIELTFHATHMLNAIPLDSIKITNLSHGEDTAVFYPNTVVSIEITPGDSLLYIGFATVFTDVGIHEMNFLENPFQLYQYYPNPAMGRSVFTLYVPDKDMVILSVKDILGRQLTFTQQILDPGYHTFYLSLEGNEIALLTATWRGITRSIKIISIGSGSIEGYELVYSGCSADVPGKDLVPCSSTDHIGDLVTFPQEHSYKMMESIAASDIILDKPIQSRSYQFIVVEGLPCFDMPYINYLGHNYKTVGILGRCWFKENLNVGTIIPIDYNGYHQANNGIIEKYCYDNDSSNCGIFGGLYDWWETVQYDPTLNPRGICPTGWHIPAGEEWESLQKNFGGGSEAGGELKSPGNLDEETGLWDWPNVGANNKSGLTILPGGQLKEDGYFREKGGRGVFWTSTSHSSINSWCVMLDSWNEAMIIYQWWENVRGFSVRCIRDE